MLFRHITAHFFGVIFLYLFFAERAQAADGDYSIFKIPANLKENAYAIIRTHEIIFTVKSPGEATRREHYVVTLLNEKASQFTTLAVGYNQKLNKIHSIQGTLYNSFGKETLRLKKSDIVDMSAVSDISLFEDSRMKVAKFTPAEYPCTIEFEYEVSTTNMLFYPSWHPQRGFNISVEQSTFQVIMPPGLDMRYREQNLPGIKAVVQPSPSGKSYRWEAKMLTALEKEPYSPSVSEWLPGVYTAPTDFEVSGYKGNMNTWQNLGKWDYDLNAQRDVLPESLKLKIQQLTAGITEPADKVKKVYEYLQANTRYVSIQLGIGGWQTFEARTVAEKGYGDCKALSNYTMAMLKAAGINSYCAMISAGEDEPDLTPDFPVADFNHIILCVPLQKDTVWLECTSQNRAFGYMGSFTGNRYALLATPTGGKLVRTPTYKAADNLQNRKAEVTLDANGDATAEVTTVYTGLQQDNINLVMHHYSPEDLKKWLYKRIDIPSFEIAKFNLTEQKNQIPAVTEQLSLSIRKCASKSGTRVFLTPNFMSAWTNIPATNDKRRLEVVTDMDFIDTDTVVYRLPKGLGVEYLPEKVQFGSRFGSYESVIQAKEDAVIYFRKVTMNKGTYPASSYPELVEFYRKVAKADKTQIVFVNKGL